ncbi:MAG: DUF5615 family PIN-like protein [Chroococcidiopsidaceae cyanobacterium CP_BM_ER_R8_30]|nr:DUF5615 family PIN-like protein [Chroococcidiopsidaceae cyanobacterium CP_BM_ER_R8_30]
MLRLLLDEHISPTISVQLRVKRSQMEVLSLKEWGYLGESDEVILSCAYEEGLTLVTYDLRTISPLLKSWSEVGRTHGGVIFIDWKTIAPTNFGALIRALSSVWDKDAQTSWRNRVVYLWGS